MARVIRFSIGICLAVAVAALAAAQEKPTPTAGSRSAMSKSSTMKSAAKHIAMNGGDVQWGDAPPSLPAGAKIAVLQGDPGKAGEYTVRVKVGDGYRIPPHWHPTRESVTVISGTFNIGAGDKFDESSAKALTAGGFSSMPARMHHYAWCKGDTEIQVHGMGPFKLIYVNKADDPRNAKKTAAAEKKS